jgi:Ca-activated chloride channel family protein
MLDFQHPALLWLIVPGLLLVYALVYRNGDMGRLLFPTVTRFFPRAVSTRAVLRRGVMAGLYAALFVFLIIALARPRTADVRTVAPEEGIDIVLAIDISGSMRAEDFKLDGGNRLNRLDVVKSVVADFIRKRTTDRIGLVVFSGYAFTQCPLTADYDILEFLLKEAKIGMIDDGTAVGSAIAAAVSRLKDVKGRSKVIILLTDGMNNAGAVSPDAAAELAKRLGIKCYTIGVGSHGPVPYPVQDMFGRERYQMADIEMDEELLRRIAAETGGQYFLATNTKELEKIYGTIDRLEKTKIDVKHYTQYHELFPAFLKLACALMLLIAGLENTVFLKIP